MRNSAAQTRSTSETPTLQATSIWKRVAVSVLICGVTGCTAGSERRSANPTEVPRAASLSFADRHTPELDACGFSNGRESGLNSILEIVGGGVACVDFDSDGRPDLAFARGGRLDAGARRVRGAGCKLMRSLEGWRFVDATAGARMDSGEIYTQGFASADFDHDGFPDVLVYGYGGAVLFANQGDGTLTINPSLSELVDGQWFTAAAWADVNDDQSLDLVLGSYVDWNFDTHQVCATKKGQPDVCAPTAFKGTDGALLINKDNGDFERSSVLPIADQGAKTLGLLAANLGSGDSVDLYVANDLVPNFLFSQEGGTWKEHGFPSGVAVDDKGIANGSMGVALLDCNLDGKFDIFVTNLDPESMGLYTNVDDFLFQHGSRQAGLNRPELGVVGFGVVAADFDGDADEDIVFTSGRVHYFPDNGPMEQLPKCLENIEGKRFEVIVPSCDFFSQPAVGRGLATCDLDGDGDLDLVATKLFGPPSLLENTCKPAAHWLCITLVGVQDARTPIGAITELAFGSRRMARQLYGGGSYLSQSQQILAFSWPSVGSNHEAVTLTIRWPNGQLQEIGEVAADRHMLIVQQPQ